MYVRESQLCSESSSYFSLFVVITCFFCSLTLDHIFIIKCRSFLSFFLISRTLLKYVIRDWLFSSRSRNNAQLRARWRTGSTWLYYYHVLCPDKRRFPCIGPQKCVIPVWIFHCKSYMTTKIFCTSVYGCFARPESICHLGGVEDASQGPPLPKWQHWRTALHFWSRVKSTGLQKKTRRL